MKGVIEFSMNTIIFLVLIGIVLILIGIIYANTTATQQKVTFGTAGVVVADTVSITYKDIDADHKSLMLTMKNVFHEDGKNIDAVAVLTVEDHLYRPDSLKEGEQPIYPIYPIPGEIEGYYTRVIISDVNINKKAQVTLWEAPCLQKIGFMQTPSTFSFHDLVNKCSSAYLASFDVKLEKSKKA